jgi:hypothetical protein
VTSPEATIFGYLGSISEVEAVFASRIYPVRLPPGVDYPAMTYQLITSPRDRTQTGVSLIMARFRMLIWGKVHDDTTDGAAVLRKYLESRDLGGPIRKSTVEEERDWEPEVQSGLFRRLLEAQLWYDPSSV